MSPFFFFFFLFFFVKQLYRIKSIWRIVFKLKHATGRPAHDGLNVNVVLDLVVFQQFYFGKKKNQNKRRKYSLTT